MIEKQIEEYLSYCKNVRGMAEATLTQKSCVLNVFARETKTRRVEELNNGVFERWMEYIAKLGLEASTVNIYNSVILTWVDYMRSIGVQVPLRRGLIGKMKGTTEKRKYYTREEIGCVVSMTDEVTGLMIWVMFETGMRIAELARMRLKDFDGRRVRFMGKGRKRREVYVSEETLGLIRAYVERYGLEDYLWCVDAGLQTCDGSPLTVCTIRAHMQAAFKGAGLDGFYPHSLRHSFATDLQRRGASVAEIKEMMGHENIATTERYLHGFDGRMKELFDKYR